MEGDKSTFRTFLDLMSLGIGNGLGIGIFVLLGDLLRNVAGPAVVISIILSALAAALAGLCFAEFGVRFLRARTVYTFCYSNHGENVSYLFGWTLMLEFIAGTASVAKGLMTFLDALMKNQISEYLASVVPLDPTYGSSYLDFFSPVVVLVVTMFIVFGLSDSAVFRNCVAAVSVALVFAIIVSGSLNADISNWTTKVAVTNVSALDDTFAPSGYLGVVKGAALAFYGFIGVEAMCVSGLDVKTPQKTIPFAIQTGVFLVLVLYAGTAAVLALMVPYTAVNPGAALPFAFEGIQWTFMKWVIIIGAFLPFYTSLVAAAVPLPRVMCSMANDGLLFGFLGRKSARQDTPISGIVIGGLVSAVVSAFFTFKILVSLTVLATLFVSTVIAFDVVLLRYVPNKGGGSGDRNSDLIICKNDITVKQVLGHLFNVGSNSPTKLSGKVAIINLVLFTTASIGLSVVLAVFSEHLTAVEAEAVIPAAVFLISMLFTAASLARQPDSREYAPFKVPLMPFVPCLCIFMNIFFMILLESLPKIIFVIWLSMGILPYLFWFSFKYWQEDLSKTSIYEINRLNSLKLHESIWKIKSEKKTFYEGAVNPVFEDDDGEVGEPQHNAAVSSDGESQEPTVVFVKMNLRRNTIPGDDDKEKNEKGDDKPEPKAQVLEHSTMENDVGVEWECTAEIHTEEPEDYEVQIVDNTYNFLSSIEEDSPKDNVSCQKLEDCITEPEELSAPVEEPRKSAEPVKRSVSVPPSVTDVGSFVDAKEPTADSNAKPVPDKRAQRPASMMMIRSKSEDDDDQAKQFKEKLNLLLKNQMNMTGTLRETISKYRTTAESPDDWTEGPAKAESLRKKIKTLNKSQMKNKLEFLLAKGPPKRFSLRNSFNIKFKEKNDDGGGGGDDEDDNGVKKPAVEAQAQA